MSTENSEIGLQHGEGYWDWERR